MHSPDLCWARKEQEHKTREFVGERLKNAGEYGIELLGSYVAPNEHTFYFILEADDFGNVSSFFGPPVLQDHTADIVPVISFGEAVERLVEEQ